MTDTIDRLIFALDGDLSSLEKVYAQAEVGSQKAGKAISTNITKATEQASAAAKKSGTEIDKAMNDTVAASAKAGKAIEDLRSKYDPAYAAARRLATTQKELNLLVASGAMTGTAAAKVMKELADATDKGHGAAGSAVREFRILFDQLSSGRMRQAPGNLLNIATRTLGISTATLAWSAALAAIPAGLAFAAFQSEQALTRVDDALRRTGHQAGVTRDQIRAMAQGIPGLSQTDALGGISTLASRGNIDPGLLRNIATAAPGYARATGQDKEKAFDELERLIADPAKASEQLNAEFKLLDVETTKQIERLASSNHLADAQALLVQKLNGRFDALAESSWSLAKGFDAFWNGVKNVWFNTGTMVSGSGANDSERLADMRQKLQEARTAQEHIKAGTFESGGGGAIHVMKALADLPGQIKQLEAKIAKDQADATAGRKGLTDNQAVGFGLKIAESYDTQAQTAKKLKEQLDSLNVAISHATGKNEKYKETLIAQRDAVDLALKHQQTPAQQAAQDAADQRRVAAAPQSMRNTLREQIAAERERDRNLANPSTAPFAESVYKSRMAVASLNNRDINRADADRKRQDEYLSKAQAEGAAQMKLADAYDHGAQAVAALRAAQEAHVAVASKEIRASQEAALTVALQAKAYGAASVAISDKIARERDANTALRTVAGAEGDPVALAKARIEAEAMAATFEQRANARTKEEIELANKKLAQLRAELGLREDLNRTASTNDMIFSRRREVGNVQGQIRAISGGANRDDMRHLEVQQQTIDDLIRRGYDPATREFQKQLKVLLPLNRALSDATDRLGKMQQEASDLAGGITGPFRDFLRAKGEMSPIDALASMGENTLNTLVENEIIDPFQKGLEGMFGGMLGSPKDLLGTSPAMPMYVQDVGDMLGGSGGDIGGLDGLFGGGGGLGEEFGGGDFIGTASDPMAGGGGGAVGGLMSLVSLFAGLFDEGGTIGPGQWGIKSGMPEIIQGGTSGVSILPLTAPVVKAATGSMGRGPGVNSNPGGAGNGPGRTRMGDTHFWNISTPNADTFIRSRSQIQARFTQAAAQGQRNS